MIRGAPERIGQTLARHGPGNGSGRGIPAAAGPRGRHIAAAMTSSVTCSAYWAKFSENIATSFFACAS